VLFQTHTPLHKFLFVGVWDVCKHVQGSSSGCGVLRNKSPLTASMGFDEGQKMRVGFLCLSLGTSSVVKTPRREATGLALQTWFVPASKNGLTSNLLLWVQTGATALCCFLATLRIPPFPFQGKREGTQLFVRRRGSSLFPLYEINTFST
jgi:hypothetical protein